MKYKLLLVLNPYQMKTDLPRSLADVSLPQGQVFIVTFNTVLFTHRKSLRFVVSITFLAVTFGNGFKD